MANKKQGFLFDDKETPAKDKAEGQTASEGKPSAMAARDAVLDKYDPEKLPPRAGAAAADHTDPMVGVGANFTPRDFDADDPPIHAAAGKALGKAAMTKLPPGAVQGNGGYVYRLNEDGSIKIEFDPIGKVNGLVLRKGSAYDAIKKELGGETAAPPEAKPADDAMETQAQADIKLAEEARARGGQNPATPAPNPTSGSKTTVELSRNPEQQAQADISTAEAARAKAETPAGLRSQISDLTSVMGKITDPAQLAEAKMELEALQDILAATMARAKTAGADGSKS